MIAVLVVSGAAGLTAAPEPTGARITGEYVEARTAEVFAGGCIMNSEAETMGRQAIMAWKITSGSFEGVALDGLTVAAAVAGDRNLGMREMGGEEPTRGEGDHHGRSARHARRSAMRWCASCARCRAG